MGPFHLAGDMSSMEYQGLGRRFVAIVIDVVILAIVGYVIALLTGSTTSTGFELEGTPAFVWFLLSFAYYVVLEAQTGQTVGKMAVGIEVVTESGSEIGYQASLVRNVLRIVDSLPLFYLIGAILIYLSDTNQRLGDRVGNTVVVSA